MMQGIDTVLFDWDGTIVDTAQASYEAFRNSMLDIGIRLEFERYAEHYSPNWQHMFEALEVPRDKWKEAESLWTRHYGQSTPDLLPGAKTVLEELRQKGFRLGIVTSGHRARVQREITGCGLEEAFQVIVCGEDVRNQKPHPEGLEIAMERVGSRPEQCCYVGDAPADMEMGKRAKVRTVGIPGKYPGSGRLIALQPNYVLGSIGEMMGCFKEKMVAQPLRG